MLTQISRVHAGDEHDFVAAAQRSQALHAPWVTAPQDAAAFATYLEKYRRDNNIGFVLRTTTGELCGCVHLNEIVRGAFLSAYLGYYAFAPHQNQGALTDGLRQVITVAFTELNLHRLEANIQPENRASIRLVTKLGFRLEGFSPRYLHINGAWRDHQRYAITAEEWRSDATTHAKPGIVGAEEPI